MFYKHARYTCFIDMQTVRVYKHANCTCVINKQAVWVL